MRDPHSRQGPIAATTVSGRIGADAPRARRCPSAAGRPVPTNRRRPLCQRPWPSTAGSWRRCRSPGLGPRHPEHAQLPGAVVSDVGASEQGTGDPRGPPTGVLEPGHYAMRGQSRSDGQGADDQALRWLAGVAVCRGVGCFCRAGAVALAAHREGLPGPRRTPRLGQASCAGYVRRVRPGEVPTRTCMCPAHASWAATSWPSVSTACHGRASTSAPPSQ